jgi:DNA mismatch repair protein MutS
MFFDDAVKASGLLGLTLTGRDCGLEERAPMCGVPYHAADSYIAKLIGQVLVIVSNYFLSKLWIFKKK